MHSRSARKKDGSGKSRQDEEESQSRTRRQSKASKVGDWFDDNNKFILLVNDIIFINDDASTLHPFMSVHRIAVSFFSDKHFVLMKKHDCQIVINALVS